MYDQFFQKYQKELLEVANSWYGRSALSIPHKEKIVRLLPNSYTILKGNQFSTQVFQLPQYAFNILGGHKNTRHDPSLLAYIAKKNYHADPYNIYDELYRGLPQRAYFHTNPTYASAGDGACLASSLVSYATARSAATADSNDGTATGGVLIDNELAGATYFVDRGFLPYDVPTLNGDTISAANVVLTVFGKGDSDTDTVALILTTQASLTTLSNDDYNNLTLNTPDEGMNRVTIDSLTSGDVQNTFTMNATGIGWIPTSAGSLFLGMRTGKEVDNTAPVLGACFFQCRYSEHATQSFRPQLNITHGVVGGARISTLGLMGAG